MLVMACNCFAQKEKPIVIHGKIITSSGSSCNEQVLCINERTKTLNLTAKNGVFTMRVHSSDTILFNAYGYSEKIICLRDSIYKPHYKINVKVEKLIDTIDNPDLAGMYSYTVNDLYTRFSRIDTAKRFVTQSNDIGDKSDALKRMFGSYINYHIKRMSDLEYYTFIEYLLRNGGVELLNESNKQLIEDTKKYYYKFRHQPRSPVSSASRNSSSSLAQCGSGTKGHGAGLLIILLACTIEGMAGH